MQPRDRIFPQPIPHHHRAMVMKANPFVQHWGSAGLIHTRRNGNGGSQSITRWMWLGMALVAAYTAQAIADWRWAWLVAWQEIELYEQLTGVVLTLVFAEQWRLAAARMEGATELANRLLTSHKKWGALAPLWLYLHADDFGHGSVRALCLTFLGLVSLGLLHQFIARLNRTWLTASWLIVHVVLATTLIYLLGLHAFNAFYYE